MNRTFKVLLLFSAISTWACRTTLPATDVQLIEKGGQTVYFAGAAAPGLSRSVACEKAITRAVRAIALRFAQEQGDLADDIADEVGAGDGEVFMQGYARQSAMDGAVDNVTFDPTAHLCQATVRWTPPVFIKAAVLEYANRLKKGELDATRPQEAPAERVPMSGDRRPVEESKPEKACRTETASFRRAERKAIETLDDFEECKRRTDGDVEGCIRYKLKAEEAAARQKSAARALSACEGT